MNPTLLSIQLLRIDENKSDIEIIYSAEKDLNGIELHGVDAGLSWVKGESIHFEKFKQQNDLILYKIVISLEDNCQFRARGYVGDTDYWEEGSNHSLVRNNNGTIRLDTDKETKERITFHGKLPLNETPSMEEIEERLNSLMINEPDLLQILIDLHILIPKILENPLESNYVSYIPEIIRFIKTEARKIESFKLDQLIRPLQKTLFEIYLDISTFTEEDSQPLKEKWKENKLLDLFEKLKPAVLRLHEGKIGDPQDQLDRFKDLLTYA